MRTFLSGDGRLTSGPLGLCMSANPEEHRHSAVKQAHSKSGNRLYPSCDLTFSLYLKSLSRGLQVAFAAKNKITVHSD